jgi:pectin methylesterase-like acyl-CoA thioesterase
VQDWVFIKTPQRKIKATLITTKKGIYMKLAVVGVMLLTIIGCDATPGSNKEEVSIGCINHANAIATDYELQAMRTGLSGKSEVVVMMQNCRYHFFNPEAKTDTSGLLTKENKVNCDALRPEFHAAAIQLRQQALDICLSFK